MILCWGIFFDLMRRDSLIAKHVADGKVAFGINHTMNDFAHNRKKDLDLVICKRGAPTSYTTSRGHTINNFHDMVAAYGIDLTPSETKDLAAIATAPLTSVASALVALEAKAAFTEFTKARPRLYDELNSSHLTIHGDTDSAIAAAFVIVNLADTFISPLRAPWTIDAAHPAPINRHRQPAATVSVIEKILQIPRRSATGGPGYDAIGLTVIDCKNDGTPIQLVSAPPAPQPGEPFFYDTFIDRLETIYATRFSAV
jgi:hypothetical protein